MSDEERLIKRAQEGDGQAVAVLYEENFDRIYRYVRFRVGDTAEAEDVTQQVFLKMLDAIKSYRWKGAPFGAWLMRIAHNEVIDYFRKKSRHRDVSLDERIGDQSLDSAGEDPRAMAEQSIEVERMMQAIAKLPPAQQEVVALRFTAGLSVAEAASVARKSQGTIKALQFNAIQSLRRLMYKDDETTES